MEREESIGRLNGRRGTVLDAAHGGALDGERSAEVGRSGALTAVCQARKRRCRQVSHREARMRGRCKMVAAHAGVCLRRILKRPEIVTH